MSLITDSTRIAEVLHRGVAEVLPDTKGLAKLMAERPIRVFLGIDPTGSLLTLGHSVVLRKLQQFAELGHEVILLIGNGTVRIGDPTGRDSTRPVLTDEAIEANFQNWKAQASKILDFTRIKIVHNGDWLDKLTYVDMVKLLGTTTVQQLLERDMFQDRLTKGLPIHGHEIIYPLLQGYDSVVMDVDLELGGTDQTFNMMMGRHLQKVYNNHEKWVLTTPIINGTDGRKMSKSYGNFVAITEAPNDMYGKLMSIADEMIIGYFTLLTDVSASEIAELEKQLASGENPMSLKKKLAHTITTMYHTAAAATKAEDNFQQVVQDKKLQETGKSNLPKSIMDNQKGAASPFDLIKCSPMDLSNSEIRRLISQGGTTIYFKDGTEKIATDPAEMFGAATIDSIKVGKRNLFKVEIEN